MSNGDDRVVRQRTLGCTWMSSLAPSTSLRSRTASMRRSLDTDTHRTCSTNACHVIQHSHKTVDNVGSKRAEACTATPLTCSDYSSSIGRPSCVTSIHGQSNGWIYMFQPPGTEGVQRVHRACKAHPAASCCPELLDQAANLTSLADASAITKEEPRPCACRRYQSE